MSDVQNEMHRHNVAVESKTSSDSYSDSNSELTAHRDAHTFATVKLSTPFKWLRLGFVDFRHIPGLSLLYGLIFATLCAGLLLLTSSIPWYALGFLTSIVVVGPFLAAGLYVASRDLQFGTKPSILRSLQLLNQRKTYLTLFSLMLALVMAAWIRFSALIFALKFTTLSPSIEAYTSLLTSTDGWIVLTFFFGIGLLLAIVVFTISAVAIPHILDKDVDFITAIQTSYQAVMHNPVAMAVWAAIIVILTTIGILTAFIGMLIIFPVLGYATWHSYRDLVNN